MTIQKTDTYYDSHWTEFAELNYPRVKTEQVRDFFHPVVNILKDSKTILDIGCGDGVHWNYLKKIEKIEIDYTGVDVSSQAVNYLKNHAGNDEGNFFVMDACKLDFMDNSFDAVFAYGVIGYTDDPRKAMEEIFRICKPGGLIGIFSPEISGISRTVLFTARSIAKLFGNRGKKILANLLVPFFGLAPSQTKITLANASWKQVREVIMTDIAPPKLEIIEYQQWMNWFDQFKIQILFDSPDVKTILWGTKP